METTVVALLLTQFYSIIINIGIDPATIRYSDDDNSNDGYYDRQIALYTTPSLMGCSPRMLQRNLFLLYSYPYSRCHLYIIQRFSFICTKSYIRNILNAQRKVGV